MVDTLTVFLVVFAAMSFIVSLINLVIAIIDVIKRNK